MAKTDFKSVAEYMASQPAAARAALNRVRSIIRKAMPDADEVISYQIPAYKLRGRAVIYFAGWKQHYSLYPATAPLVAAFQSELSPYPVSKGTIRFPLSQSVPVKLIERIAKFRAAESVAPKQAKSPVTRAKTMPKKTKVVVKKAKPSPKKLKAVTSS